VQTAAFVATTLVGGAAAEEFILGGGAAGLLDSAIYKAGVSCLQSAICRLVFGMAGGAGVTAHTGETTDTILGKQAHRNYPNMLDEPGYDYNRQISGTRLRADAIDWNNNIVRELKPDNMRAIQRGLIQLGKYVDALENLTGETWTGILDIYEKND
jgi:hypothetical protein